MLTDATVELRKERRDILLVRNKRPGHRGGKRAKSRAEISDDDVKSHEIDAIDETHDHDHGHGGDDLVSDVTNDEHEDGGGESTVNGLLALWINLPPMDDVEAE